MDENKKQSLEVVNRVSGGIILNVFIDKWKEFPNPIYENFAARSWAMIQYNNDILPV